MVKGACYTSRNIQLRCAGDPEYRAGCVFDLKIQNLGDTPIDSRLLVRRCTHIFANQLHKMEIETCFINLDESEKDSVSVEALPQ